MNVSQELWQTYRNSVYGGPIPLTQERECSRCFYAGIASALTAMIAIVDSNEPEELLAKRLELFMEQNVEAAAATLQPK